MSSLRPAASAAGHGTNSQLSENARLHMEAGNAHFYAKEFPAALAKYEGALQLFRAALQYESLSKDRREKLVAYAAQCEGLVVSMRQRGIVAERPAAAPTTATSPRSRVTTMRAHAAFSFSRPLQLVRFR